MRIPRSKAWLAPLRASSLVLFAFVTTTAARADGDAPIVAAKQSKVFHTQSCSAAQKINEANAVHFKTAEEAEASGRRLCRMCSQLLGKANSKPKTDARPGANKNSGATGGRLAASQPADASPALRFVAIKKVLPGGTLLTEEDDKLQLLGIHCPEEGQPLSREVVRFIREQTRGHKVRVGFDTSAGPTARRDDLGRLMVYVFAQPGERDLGQELLFQGFGWLDYGVECDRRTTYLEQEDEAWWHRKGVWQPLSAGQGEREVLIGRRAHEYHPPGCPHVDHLIQPLRVTINEAKARRLAPCDGFRESIADSDSKRPVHAGGASSK